jgi:cell division septal protein FtsQ
MSPVASVAADRRFRRAHVKPARKRHGWRALVKPLVRAGVVATLVGVGGYRGASVVTHAHVLQIDRILVSGNERMSKGEVLAVLNGLRGESLVWTDLDAWRQRLMVSPWVRDAALRRSLPSTVEVVVAERQPIGLGRIDGDLYLVDDRGVIIDQYGPQYADFDLPIVDGLTAAATDSNSASDPKWLADDGRAELAARLIAALEPSSEIAKQLSQVDVTDPHNASVILNGDPAAIQLGEDRFLPRLESYLGLASALRERVAGIDSVDLRFDGRIYVRPAAKTGRDRRTNRLRQGSGGPPTTHAEAEAGGRERQR